MKQKHHLSKFFLFKFFKVSIHVTFQVRVLHPVLHPCHPRTRLFGFHPGVKNFGLRSVSSCRVIISSSLCPWMSAKPCMVTGRADKSSNLVIKLPKEGNLDILQIRRRWWFETRYSIYMYIRYLVIYDEND